jgi:hypothetical protein
MKTIIETSKQLEVYFNNASESNLKVKEGQNIVGPSGYLVPFKKDGLLGWFRVYDNNGQLKTVAKHRHALKLIQ